MLFDEQKCDGCGLCVPACPENVIALPTLQLDIREETGGPSAFAACDQLEEKGDALLPCVHALGLRDLFWLYGREGERLVVASGRCADCARGNADSLQNKIDKANALLKSRGAKPLHMETLSSNQWQNRYDKALPLGPTDKSKRRFFQSMAKYFSSVTSEIVENSSSDNMAYPGLPDASPTLAALYVHVPEFLPQDCVGCDACISVCPHGAISLDRDSQNEAYRIDAGNCTGCGLCLDICDKDAIHLLSIAPLDRSRLVLTRKRCYTCGVSYHYPEESGVRNNQCHICSGKGQDAKLFQVYD